MNFLFENGCGIETNELLRTAADAQIALFHDQFKTIVTSSKNYEHPFSCLNLPADQQLLTKVKEAVVQVQALQPTILVVVGIGGSSLGTKAVIQALQGRLRDPQVHALRVYFAETVDTDRMYTILSIVEHELQKGNTIILNVVTKSGTTVETLANFYLLVDLVKRYAPDTYQKMVIVTTDEGSPLWQYGHQEKFQVLTIPKAVGGRYSVFSAVGLFPLALLGVALDELRAGALAMVERCLQSDLLENPALLSALIHYHHYKNGVTISDMFLFSVDLEALGKWYRQLMAESIGKEFDLRGERVLVGITPTVSLGSIDLHSVAQLYLAGPRDKYTTFVTVEKSSSTITIPHDAPALGGKTFAEIMNALAEGTQVAYRTTNRPFSTVVLPQKDAFSLGQFLQWKMIEMIYLGFLLQVDCFDQPNVELYKKEAARLLR